MCREVEAYAEKRALEAAIQTFVKTSLRYGVSNKKLITDLMGDYHLTEEEAKTVLQDFGSSTGIRS